MDIYFLQSTKLKINVTSPHTRTYYPRWKEWSNLCDSSLLVSYCYIYISDENIFIDGLVCIVEER